MTVDLSFHALQEASRQVVLLPASTPQATLVRNAAAAVAACDGDAHDQQVCLGQLLLALLLAGDSEDPCASAQAMLSAPAMPVGNGHAWALEAYASIPTTDLAGALRRLCVWHPEVQELHLSTVSRQLALQSLATLQGQAPKFLPATAIEVSLGHDCWDDTVAARDFVLVELLTPGQGSHARHVLSEVRFPAAHGPGARTLGDDLRVLRDCITALTRDIRRRV